jgi:hypothetical protein
MAFDSSMTSVFARGICTHVGGALLEIYRSPGTPASRVPRLALRLSTRHRIESAPSNPGISRSGRSRSDSYPPKGGIRGIKN